MGQNQLQLSATVETIRVNELFTKVHRNAPFPVENIRTFSAEEKPNGTLAAVAKIRFLPPSSIRELTRRTSNQHLAHLSLAQPIRY